MFEIEMFGVYNLNSNKLEMLTNTTASKSEAEAWCVSLLAEYPSAAVFNECDAFNFG